jgi:hypothetical protein
MKRKMLTVIGAAMVFAALACSPAAEPTATPIPQAVTISADRDNTLIESNDGSLSNGLGPHIFVGTTNAGPIRRALVRFPVDTAIPDGATVTAVTLVL